MVEDVEGIVEQIKLLSGAVGSGTKQKMDNKLKVTKWKKQ